LDSSIKQYADSLYEKELFDSAAALRGDLTKHLHEMAKRQTQTQVFSGVDYQLQVKIYVDHIDRTTAARLESYRKAFDEIRRSPTEVELREIFDDFKSTLELQIKHATQALSGFLAARGGPAGLEPSGALRAGSAHGHDRVLREWKIWRGKIHLQESTSNLKAQKVLTAGMESVNKENRESAVKSAFISYSWDDENHQEWVRALAGRLRADGVNVTIDRWGAVPGDQLPAFMERAIRDNEFVVIICTPRYKVRSDAREGGVGYEGDIMTAEVMTTQNHRKFIPVLRSGNWLRAAPIWLQGKYYINLSGEPYSERYYEDLARTLLGIRETPPPIGQPLATIIPRMYREAGPSHEPNISKFEDIKITRVIVEEITEPRNDGTPGSALYMIPFALSDEPPDDWVQLFAENWDHPQRFTSMHRPGIASIHGSTVTLNGTTIEEVELYHRDTLQLAVSETNRQFRETRGVQRRTGTHREEHRKRVEDISKRIKFD
jgi:hypothetical protein